MTRVAEVEFLVELTAIEFLNCDSGVIVMELGTIEQVDLRQMWPHESNDFTPWLANNVSRLGDALGLELETRGQEAPVGGYSLDILAHDLGSNRKVIIENQLESTNHDHLGKLLTYASGYDAGVVVWLAKEFRDEHRQALDWLNQRTGEDTQFFGVIVELIRIDDSNPAVNFKLAASPNEWRKESIDATKRGARGTSERGERYRGFFQNLIDRLREEEKFTTARKGQPMNYYDFASGHGGIAYRANFRWDDMASIVLYIDRREKDYNKNIFDQLMADRDSIESELSETLEWSRLDDYRASRVDVVRPGTIDDNAETLEEIQDWMVNRLLAFKKVYDPRLASVLEA